MLLAPLTHPPPRRHPRIRRGGDSPCPSHHRAIVTSQRGGLRQGPSLKKLQISRDLSRGG
jgi:hypothetical protein